MEKLLQKNCFAVIYYNWTHKGFNLIEPFEVLLILYCHWPVKYRHVVAVTKYPSPNSIKLCIFSLLFPWMQKLSLHPYRSPSLVRSMPVSTYHTKFISDVPGSKCSQPVCLEKIKISQVKSCCSRQFYIQINVPCSRFRLKKMWEKFEHQVFFLILGRRFFRCFVFIENIKSFFFNLA